MSRAQARNGDRRFKSRDLKREYTVTTCAIDAPGVGGNLMARATPPRPDGFGWTLLAVRDRGTFREAAWSRLV